MALTAKEINIYALIYFGGDLLAEWFEKMDEEDKVKVLTARMEGAKINIKGDKR